jgi:hypothetical protein
LARLASFFVASRTLNLLRLAELENDFQVDIEGISDEQILHSTVGISRRDIEKLKISVEDYPKSQTLKLRADYSNLNKFRVRLATKKEASLAKLSPCEATFHQHVLRASLKTYIWKSSRLMTFVPGRRQVPDHHCLPIRILKETKQGTALFVRISRYRSSKMLLVHADGMSLRMVITWPGLLLFLLQVRV